MNVTHSYICHSQDIAGVTMKDGMPVNFIMNDFSKWVKLDWSNIGEAKFCQEKDGDGNNQSLSVQIKSLDGLNLLLDYACFCALVAAHFIDDGRCFFQGIDAKATTVDFNPSFLSNRFFTNTIFDTPGIFGSSEMKCKTRHDAPELPHEYAENMESILKAL